MEGRDIAKAIMDESDKLAVAAWGRSPKTSTKDGRKPFKMEPPVLTGNLTGGLSVVGVPFPESVAPRVMIIAMLMPRMCLHCTVFEYDHVNPDCFKRCSRCHTNGGIDAWFCCKDCQARRAFLTWPSSLRHTDTPSRRQLAEFKDHKAACKTPHDDRVQQATLKVSLCFRPDLGHPLTDPSAKQVIGEDCHTADNVGKRVQIRLYQLHSKSARQSTRDSISRIQLTGTPQEAMAARLAAHGY
jgi:hypothetical protein